MGYNDPLTCSKSKDGEKYRSMSVCADSAGLHEPMLFARALSPLFLTAWLIFISFLEKVQKMNFETAVKEFLRFICVRLQDKAQTPVDTKSLIV